MYQVVAKRLELDSILIDFFSSGDTPRRQKLHCAIAMGAEGCCLLHAWLRVEIGTS